ncbi:MAG: hypothetical protein ACR2G3_00680 [Solirubrobacterales bacterium]
MDETRGHGTHATKQPISTAIRSHLRSNVYGLIAIFIAVGGTAYAADGPLPGQNQVGSADIINGEVKPADLDSDAVRTGKVLDNTLTSADIADDTTAGALTGTDIASETITALDIADDAVGKSEIGTGAVGQDEIASSGVGGAEIATSAVGTDEIAPGAVRSEDILNGGVGAADVTPVVTRTSTITISTSGFFAVTASCNLGERLLSGGWDWNPGRVGDEPTNIIDAQRSSDNGWTVVGNVGGIAQTGFAQTPTDLTAEAYCLDN